MSPTDLIAHLQKVPKATGRFTISPDFIYPTQMGFPDVEYGYDVRALVDTYVVVGRGLTIEEACDALKMKLDHKYKVE